jgi:hypothetical protein
MKTWEARDRFLRYGPTATAVAFVRERRQSRGNGHRRTVAIDRDSIALARRMRRTAGTDDRPASAARGSVKIGKPVVSDEYRKITMHVRAMM